jgi:hypothetical protein
VCSHDVDDVDLLFRVRPSCLLATIPFFQGFIAAWLRVRPVNHFFFVFVSVCFCGVWVQEAQRAGHLEAAAFLQQQIAQQLQQREQQAQDDAAAADRVDQATAATS